MVVNFLISDEFHTYVSFSVNLLCLNLFSDVAVPPPRTTSLQRVVAPDAGLSSTPDTDKRRKKRSLFFDEML